MWILYCVSGVRLGDRRMNYFRFTHLDHWAGWTSRERRRNWDSESRDEMQVIRATVSRLTQCVALN